MDFGIKLFVQGSFLEQNDLNLCVDLLPTLLAVGLASAFSNRRYLEDLNSHGFFSIFLPLDHCSGTLVGNSRS